MIFREISSYDIVQVMVLSAKRTTVERVVDRINAWFWRVVGL